MPVQTTSTPLMVVGLSIGSGSAATGHARLRAEPIETAASAKCQNFMLSPKAPGTFPRSVANVWQPCCVGATLRRIVCREAAQLLQSEYTKPTRGAVFPSRAALSSAMTIAMSDSEFVFVYSTFPDETAAKRVAEALVTAR